jgi:hypothetical protein
MDHAMFSVLVGKPSSPTVPLRIAGAGKVMVCADPALTVGGWFRFPITNSRDPKVIAEGFKRAQERRFC